VTRRTAETCRSVHACALACLLACTRGPPAEPLGTKSEGQEHPNAAHRTESRDQRRLPSHEQRTAAGLVYVERVSGGANVDERLPLIVAIHGLGDEPAGFAGLVVDLPAPARIVLPRAPDPYDEGWSWFPVRARDGEVTALATGIRDAADRLAAMIVEISATRPVIGKAIVTGFSQGGMLAFTLAVHHPEVVEIAIPVGGWLPPPLWPEVRPTTIPRIVALHGETDPTVRFAPTKASIEHLRALGWDATLRGYPGVKHAISPQMRVDLHALLAEAVNVTRGE